ncbi:hypothetical protein TrRE_jg7337, partial [Triparma retinervis]
MVVIDNSDASPAAAWIISQVKQLEGLPCSLSGEEGEDGMDGMMDGTTPLPFGRRPIAFFDEGSTISYTKQARSIVKELIVANELGQTMQELKDLTPLFETEICLASSLVLESLTAVKKESLHGMAAAYDMLVTAGSLLLQEAVTPITAVKAVEKAIISNVTPKGAETILHLSEIRDMCGSLRYKFRFVERVAPALIRPPNGALWCVRHQCDMRAIVLVAEIMLDNAKVFFRDGWTDRAKAMQEAEAAKERETEGKEGEGERETGTATEETKETSSPIPTIDTSTTNPNLPSPSNYPHTQFVSNTGSPRSPRSPPHNHQYHDQQLTKHEISSLDSMIMGSIGKVLCGSPHPPPLSTGASQAVPLSPRISPPSSASSPSKASLASSAGTPPRSPIDMMSPPSSPRTSVREDGGSSRATANNGNAGTPKVTAPKYTRFGRRRMITACRALRSQINSFEEQFKAVHGHAPKGNEERKPFATTYATYREWKKGLRGDAGVRVQAIVRGWLVRRRRDAAQSSGPSISSSSSARSAQETAGPVNSSRDQRQA